MTSDSTSATRKRAIIGLMGGTGGNDQVGDAQTIGTAVAVLDQILLTGAEVGNANSARLHERAMYGATLTGNARLIGILPRTGVAAGPPPPALKTAFDPIEGVRGFYYRPGITSKERDFMTGASPDALIFLKGETGTLCELAFALAAGRKTYLFDSATALRQALLESNLDYALGLAHSHCSSIAGKPITVKTLKQGL